MFAVGDNVLYGTDGVCTIADHGMRDFFGDAREYYILKPNADPSGIVYVPADNPALVERMRRLMTKEEIDGILAECAATDDENGYSPDYESPDYDSPDCESPDWIADDGERKHAYDGILQSGDRQRIFRMIRALYQHREIIAKRGKKLHIADERLLRDAESRMNAELAHVLSIAPEEVPAYVAGKLGEH